MAGIVYCHDCKRVLMRAKDRGEACRLATMHMAATPHILVFGYTEAEAKRNGWI